MRRVKKRETTPEGPPAEAGWLTRDEDDELRRLHYFSNFGALAGQRLERFLELRHRDRRKNVRVPREFDVSEMRKPDAGVDEHAAPRPHPNLWLRGNSPPGAGAESRSA